MWTLATRNSATQIVHLNSFDCHDARHSIVRSCIDINQFDVFETLQAGFVPFYGTRLGFYIVESPNACLHYVNDCAQELEYYADTMEGGDKDGGLWLKNLEVIDIVHLRDRTPPRIPAETLKDMFVRA